ncbi:histidine kinase [Nonomuraea ferruginea]
MELSRAQRQLDKDPEAAQATIRSAITSTRETLGELRALSRGIAPPVLSDRGLAPALAALVRPLHRPRRPGRAGHRPVRRRGRERGLLRRRRVAHQRGQAQPGIPLHHPAGAHR